MSNPIDVPSRDADQVKVAGAELDQVVEVSENSDGGPNKADHDVDTARVHDHGISSRDHENQSAQRILRQDVKKPDGSPGLVAPAHENYTTGPNIGEPRSGGTLLTDPLN